MADTCTISGTILYADGNPTTSAHVVARIESTEQDQGGQVLGGAGIVSDPVEAFTEDDGSFQIVLIQGGRYRLEIPFINLRKTILVPTEPTANFVDLV